MANPGFRAGQLLFRAGKLMFGCCCTGGGGCTPDTKCFRKYTSTYTCGGGGSWGAPVAGDRVCLATSTDTAWTATANPCVYQKYVPCGASDPNCCTGDGDCSGCSASTPSAPVGAPAGCCGCVCTSGATCASCSGGTTPLTFQVAFDGLTESPKCFYVGDSPFEQWTIDFSAVNGNAYVATQTANPCVWTVEVPVKIMECHWSGEGDPDANNCHPCEDGQTDVTVTATLTINAASSPAVYIAMVWSYRGGTTSAQVNLGNADCCGVSVITLPAASGSENWYDALDGTVIVSNPPC